MRLLFHQLFSEVESTNSLYNCAIDRGMLVEEVIDEPALSRDRLRYADYYNSASLIWNVLPRRMSPVSNPNFSHFMRWAEVPWVNDSG